jgi:hypothetical protein
MRSRHRTPASRAARFSTLQAHGPGRSKPSRRFIRAYHSHKPVQNHTPRSPYNAVMPQRNQFVCLPGTEAHHLFPFMDYYSMSSSKGGYHLQILCWTLRICALRTPPSSISCLNSFKRFGQHKKSRNGSYAPLSIFLALKLSALGREGVVFTKMPAICESRISNGPIFTPWL